MVSNQVDPSELPRYSEQLSLPSARLFAKSNHSSVDPFATNFRHILSHVKERAFTIQTTRTLNSVLCQPPELIEDDVFFLTIITLDPLFACELAQSDHDTVLVGSIVTGTD
jgi:hypothetical protein